MDFLHMSLFHGSESQSAEVQYFNDGNNETCLEISTWRLQRNDTILHSTKRSDVLFFSLELALVAYGIPPDMFACDRVQLMIMVGLSDQDLGKSRQCSPFCGPMTKCQMKGMLAECTCKSDVGCNNVALYIPRYEQAENPIKLCALHLVVVD